MPQFKDVSALVTYVRQAVDKSLTDDVFPVVRDIEVDVIEEEVYDVYKPKFYKRRSSGGFRDPDNLEIVGGAAKNGELAIVNTTQPNPYLDGRSSRHGYATMDKDMNEVITFVVDRNTDGSYDYWPDPFERPFIQPTVERLKSSGDHIKALKKGLKKQGITAK